MLPNKLLNPVRVLTTVEHWPDVVSTRRENATRDTAAFKEMIDILQFQLVGFGKEAYRWNLLKFNIVGSGTKILA